MVPLMVVHTREKEEKITRVVNRIEKLNDKGAGTFGKITECNFKGRKMALKEFTFGNAPIHTTTIREIKAMRLIKSPYILEIREILIFQYKIHLLFDLYDCDLYKLIGSRELDISDIKSIFWQILKGIEAVHSGGYIHRDIKSANILIRENLIKKTPDAVNLVEESYDKREERNYWEFKNSNHERETDNKKKIKSDLNDVELLKKHNYSVKICDFGMARPFGHEMTPGVVTLWYRAPELLLGTRLYTNSIDIWSLGCILLEMFLRAPVFKANTEIEELKIITDYCGAIPQELQDKFNFKSTSNNSDKERCILEKFKQFNSEGIDLADKMLSLDPELRPTIYDCLKHPFFKDILELQKK